MFYSEEDLTPAVNAAVETFGPMSNIIESKQSRRNITIASKEFGKLWFGDTDVDIEQGCKLLSKRINQVVYAFDNNAIFDYGLAFFVSPLDNPLAT